MAFVAEDGSGLANSNSYSTVDEIKDHFTDRGVTIAQSFTDAEIQASAIKATDYMDKRFGRRYRGFKQSHDQALEWPRLDAEDDSGYLLLDRPVALLKAHAEYTLLDLQLTTLTPLPTVPFPTVDPDTGTVSEGAGTITHLKDTVGPIETERNYQSPGSDKPMTSSGNLIQGVREYPVADLWMEELLTSYVSRDLGRG